MSYTSGYQHYKEQSVATMTKGEMLILLYDEIIKRLNKAKIVLNNNDTALFDSEITRTKEIILYLNNTLNRKYPVSAEIARIYDFISYELSRVGASRNVQIIDEVLPFIVDFRDTFKEADRLSKKGNKTAIGG